MSAAPLFILCIISLVLVVSSVKVCEESARLATLRLGRMMPLRGPGLVILIPNIERCIKVKTGDRAEVVDGGSARIRGFSFPISSAERLTEGTWVRVVGFDGSQIEGKARVERDTDSRKEIKCEKCGNTILI